MSREKDEDKKLRKLSYPNQYAKMLKRSKVYSPSVVPNKKRYDRKKEAHLFTTVKKEGDEG